MPQYTDLYMRDSFTDGGVTPVPDGYYSASPDVMPVGGGQLDPSTTPYGPPLINVPINNQNVNHIYVRAANGGSASASGQIYLYWSDATLLPNVAAWRANGLQNLNGTDHATISNVPAKGNAFGDQPFAWNPSAAPNKHYCLVARVQTATHPNPLPTSFDAWGSFASWVSRNPNVAWHNLDVVNRLPALGYQNSLYFYNPGSDPTSFYTFTATYQSMPVGSVLRIYATKGPGFPGFDTGPLTTTQASGVLPVSCSFPPQYGTTVITTCSFPGAPTTPPPGTSIVVESWGPEADIDAPEHAALKARAHRPERLGVLPADVGLDANGRLVPIMAFHTLFAPTAESTAAAFGPRIFAPATPT